MTFGMESGAQNSTQDRFLEIFIGPEFVLSRSDCTNDLLPCVVLAFVGGITRGGESSANVTLETGTGITSDVAVLWSGETRLTVSMISGVKRGESETEW